MSRINVCLRIRPFFPDESHSKTILNPVSPNLVEMIHPTQSYCRNFVYDHIFPPDTSQEMVYDKVGKIIVQKVMEGYNGTLLAYGQTNSGKSYTMGFLGNLGEENNGLVQRCAKDIFSMVVSHERESNSQKLHEQTNHSGRIVEFVPTGDTTQNDHSNSGFDIQVDQESHHKIHKNQSRSNELVNQPGQPLFNTDTGINNEKYSTLDKETDDNVNKNGILMENNDFPQPKNAMITTLRGNGQSPKNTVNEDIESFPPKFNSENGTCIIPSQHNQDIKIYMDFVQIYLEKIQDLLNPEDSNLTILEGKDGTLSIPSLTRVEVKSVEEVLHYLSQGLENRIVAPTLMNSTSSRSHTILSLHIRRQSKMKTIESTLRICDLAGSERIYRSGSSGLRLDEAKCINKSLSTLGLVVSSLAEKKSKIHIPFRDSKLTRLLKPVLASGNSNTIFIITASPTEWSFSDTLSTLQFGQRCMHVETNAILNEKEEIDYKSLSIKLQARIRELESQVQLQSLHNLNTQSIKYPNILTSENDVHIAKRDEIDDVSSTEDDNDNLAWNMCNALHDSLYQLYTHTRNTIEEVQTRSKQMEELWTPKHKLDDNANLNDLRLRRIAIVNETMNQIRTEFPMTPPFTNIISQRIEKVYHSDTTLDRYTQQISGLFHSTYSYIDNLKATLKARDEQIEKLKRDLAKHIVDQINEAVNGSISNMNNEIM